MKHEFKKSKEQRKKEFEDWLAQADEDIDIDWFVLPERESPEESDPNDEED